MAVMGKRVVELVLYAALAVASTWPLAAKFGSHLPIGTEPVATVPLLNLWTIWWNVDRLGARLHGYWDAPIFHPVDRTFAFSEPQPLTGLMTWPIWQVASPVATYNAVVLISLALNGWAACQLFRKLRLMWPAALIGGAMVEVLPYIHWQLGVLQLVPLWGVIWTIGALWSLGRRPTKRAVLSLGLAGAATYLLCSYYGLFLAVVLAGTGWLLIGSRLLRWRTWAALGASAMIALVVASPVLWMQWQVMREHQFSHAAETMTVLSAEPQYFLYTPWKQLVPLPITPPEDPNEPWRFSPGTLKLLLAAFGAVYGLSLRRHRRLTVFSLAALGLSIVLCGGLKLHWGGTSLAGLLVEYCPGFAQIRSFYRFAVLAQLLLVILAALGIHGLLRWAHLGTRRYFPALLVRSRARNVAHGTQAKHSFRRWFASAAAIRAAHCAVIAACGAVIVGEAWPRGAFGAWPPETRLVEIPSLEQNEGWIRWLQTETPADAVVAFAPFPRGSNADDYLPTAWWMYLQMYHARTMVNGYSGFFPESFLELKKTMAGFPSQVSLSALRARDVSYVLVDPTVHIPTSDDGAIPGLALLYTDAVSKMRIFSLAD